MTHRPHANGTAMRIMVAFAVFSKVPTFSGKLLHVSQHFFITKSDQTPFHEHGNVAGDSLNIRYVYRCEIEFFASILTLLVYFKCIIYISIFIKCTILTQTNQKLRFTRHFYQIANDMKTRPFIVQPKIFSLIFNIYFLILYAGFAKNVKRINFRLTTM